MWFFISEKKWLCMIIKHKFIENICYFKNISVERQRMWREDKECGGEDKGWGGGGE